MSVTLMFRAAQAGLLVLSLFLSRVAWGDLYTGSARSTDWLVDSSDEIVHLRVDRRGAADLEPIVVGTLKRRLTPDGFRAALVPEPRTIYRIDKKDDGVSRLQFRYVGTEHWVNAGRHCARPAEWLLFIRSDGRTWRLAHSINLTHPRETSLTAAFTPSGDALTTKEQIVATVTARITLNRSVPATCDRELLEQRKDHQFKNWYEETRRTDWYLTTPQVAAILGGFHIPISNLYWDDPEEGDQDEDLLLISILVPADKQYARELFQRVDGEKYPSDQDLLAMLNYPGREAERILEKVAGSEFSNALTASRVLNYLQYRRAPDHPLDAKLIGRWEILGRNERIELELSKDHTCVVNTRPTEVTRRLAGYQPVDGRGYWAIRDGKLWIGRNQVQRDGKWTPNRREFFPPKTMLRIEPNAITLDGGPPMKRRPAGTATPRTNEWESTP